MVRIFSLAGLCCAIFLCSCSRSNNLLFGEVQAQVGSHTVRVTDCYRTSVPPPRQLAEASYQFMPCRDADVRIRAGELTVNGRSYGRLQEGDAILVDHGAVSVIPPGLQTNARR